MSKKAKADVNRLLAYRLSLARETVGMTQKELAEKTGIYQADISKIERGLANPSVSTLKRLADGLNMNLVIEFKPKEDVAV
ncbi:MAG: helix-turn-helix transcriptional regulator [Lachnospiraceae bacterium]|nr:helix-turn-helix transcriptional regulator [Lachnospiraceae bacterium]